MTDRQAWIATPIAVAAAALVTWAGSQGGTVAGGVPVFALCAALAFVINWVAFVPAYLGRTEMFYDLTGSLTYLTVTASAVWLSGARDPRSLLLAALVVLWASRLGSFLFLRIRRDGRDGRFDELKQSFARFLMAWTLQGLWVVLTLAAALAAITGEGSRPLGVLALVGAVIWGLGFSIEVIADRQKSRFRADPANRGRFIRTGLWARSRHPNYFGEITLWAGVALVALPELSGWRYLTLISPFFVYVLLTKGSGIPLLEERADGRWGGEPDYEAYKERTPILVPQLRSGIGDG